MDRNTAINRNRRIRRTLTAGVLGIALLGLTPLSAHAWGRGDRDPDPERALTRLTERLDLTDEQQAQVRQILEESFDKRRDIKEQKREQMEELKQETDDQLAEALNEEQMEKLRKLQEERNERRGERRGRRFDR